MTNELRPFRTFRSYAEAEDFAGVLTELGFAPAIEDNSKLIPDTFVGAAPDYFVVNLAYADFERAENALDADAERQLAEVDPDHYLFGFTNEELIEVVTKPDEWNAFDRQLARKVLADRGMPVKEATIDVVKEQRLEELEQPAPPQTLRIFRAYMLCLFGGFMGVFIGYHLNTAKKMLPNGERVYVYREADRWHGKVLFFGGLVLFTAGIVWWLSRL